MIKCAMLFMPLSSIEDRRRPTVLRQSRKIEHLEGLDRLQMCGHIIHVGSIIMLQPEKHKPS